MVPSARSPYLIRATEPIHLARGFCAEPFLTNKPTHLWSAGLYEN